MADDDADMRALLATLLGRQGYDVVQAQDGAELLACLARRAPPDAPAATTVQVVVSDVSMPGASGLDALAALRERYGTLPIILMTGFGSDELHERARALGVVAVLDKPFGIDELTALVGRVVGRSAPTRGHRAHAPGLSPRTA